MTTPPGSGPLGPGPEFDRIRAMLNVSQGEVPEVLTGPGDDAAVLRSGGEPLVVTTDMSVEGVHFRRDWLSPFEIGHRAAVASLSDIAAMAALPVAVTTAIACPRGTPRGELVEIQRGLAEACARWGGGVVGGDLTRSPGPIVIEVTALGRAASPVLRSTARVGDEVWVSGRLGGAAAAVAGLEAGRGVPDDVRAAYATPVPRVEEAVWLVAHVDVHAMIDLSDGLGGDAGHVAAASDVSIVLEASAVPLAEAAGSRDEALQRALAGGEDYELCFTVRPGSMTGVAAAFVEAFGVEVTRVGEVVARGEALVLLDDGDRIAPLASGGFDHFAPRDGEAGPGAAGGKPPGTDRPCSD